MNQSQVTDVSASEMPCVTEEELALWRIGKGARIVRHLGRYWTDSIRGFYQPIHHLARFSLEEASAPATLLWGYRAALREEDVGAANATMPVHVFENLADCSLETLDRKLRGHVKKSRKLVEIVALDGPGILREQGHAVAVSSILRTMGGTRYSRPPSREKYVADLEASVLAPRLLYLAGLIDGKLGGYISGFAVDGTAYIQAVHIETEALKTDIGSGLLFEFIQCCRRTAAVRELSYGIEAPEKPSLGKFKESWGFPVKQVPAKSEMNPLIGGPVRRLYPEKYYRLTGRR